MERRKNPRQRSAQYNPKELGMDVVRRRAKSTDVAMESMERKKRNRKRKN